MKLLVAESKEAITLAGSIAGERGRPAHQGSNTICIPKKAILKRRVLKA